MQPMEKISLAPVAHLSVRSIAIKLNRHFTSVKRSIERLGIEPVAYAGTHKFYHPDVTEVVGKNLRKTNTFASK